MPITDLIPIPDNINPGLNAARQLTMLSLLGSPRGSYTRNCRPVTHQNIRRLLVTENVGPFVVSGLAPAVNSLRQVMEEVRNEDAEVFEGLGTAGMLCARLVRGSASSISNHSWGTAVDLTLNGILDERGDEAETVQAGLARIAPIFNRNGWYWGAGFRVEDAMHFELSDQKIRQLHAAGAFSGSPATLPPPSLSVGDRGQQVRRLQERLNELGSTLIVDGIFGPSTHAEVVAFQIGRGLTPDGIVGPNTRAALGL